MDTILLLKSVSTITIVAFGITLAIVVFEIYSLLKNRTKDAGVSIPEFKGDPLKTKNLDIKSAGVYEQERQKTYLERKKRVRLMSYLVSLAILLGVTLVGLELVIRSRGEKIEQKEVSLSLPTYAPTKSADEPIFLTSAPTLSPTFISTTPTISLTIIPTQSDIVISQAIANETEVLTGIQTSTTPIASSSQKASQLPVSGWTLGSIGIVGIFALFISFAFLL